MEGEELLRLDHVNQGGDTEILPLAGEQPPLSSADIPNTLLETETDPTVLQACETELNQEEDRQAAAEGPLPLTAMHTESPVEMTAILDDGSGQAGTAVTGVGKLEEAAALEDTQLDVEPARDEILSNDKGSPSSLESLSQEEGISSPDSLEGSIQADQLLGGENAVLEELEGDIAQHESPQQSQPHNAAIPASNAGPVTQEEDRTVLRSQLARAKRHAKLYYTKVRAVPRLYP